MRDTQKAAIWILAVLLAIALIYIGYGMYQNFRYKEQVSAANYGYQTGYGDAVVKLMQQAATCQAVPVTIGNQTLNLIAVECL